jgi:hypothetical protein
MASSSSIRPWFYYYCCYLVELVGGRSIDRSAEVVAIAVASRRGRAGGHHLRRLDALQQQPVLRGRLEPVKERRHVPAAVHPVADVAGVLLLRPEELALQRRGPVVLLLRRRCQVVERHHGGRRRRPHQRGAVVPAGAEADHGPGARAAAAAGPVGAGRDAGELLHHGAEVGGVRVEQRDGRAAGRAGPPPRGLRDAPALHPRLRAGGAANGPAGRRARHRPRPRGGRHHGRLRRRRRAVPAAVEPGPVGHVRARVTHGGALASYYSSYCCPSSSAA